MSENKIAIVGDFHIGRSKDSEIKHSTISTTVEWICNQCEINNVDTLVIVGDIHDNRNALTLISMGASSELIDKLNKQVKVIILSGNHDSAVKKGLDKKLNSLVLFKYYPNVKSVIDTVHVEKIDNKILAFIPWGIDIETAKLANADFAFGHFEFDGASLAHGESTNTNISIKDIMTIAPLVFSGHYHIRNEYTSDNRKLISVGSPCELDWGDSGTTKGLYILDTTNRTYTFIENNLTPKHVKIYLSTLINKSTKLVPELIKNNYVKLLIDQKIKYDTIKKLTDLINSFNPIKSCELDFIVNMNIKSDITLVSKNIEMNNKSKIDYLKNYIGNIDQTMFVKNTKDDVQQLAEHYYNIAQTNIE